MIRKFLLSLLVVTLFAVTVVSAAEEEHYLARGTWYFSGSGTGTVNGILYKADATNGKAVIESTGEAGDEYVTHVTDSSTWHITGSDGINVIDTISENEYFNYHNTTNNFSYTNGRLTWEATQTSDTTAEITCYGTAYVDGYRVDDFRMNYNASTTGTPEAPVSPGGGDSDSGGGCSVGVFSPLLGLLLVPLFLLRK